MHKGVKRASEKAFCSLVALATVSLAASAGFAAEWRVTPHLDAEVTFSDNVDIDNQGENQSDIIFTTRPGVAITATGKRLRLNLDYVGSYYVFTDSGEEQYRNSLSGLISFDAIEDFLTIDARASISTPFINLRGARSFSGANFSQNRRERQTYSISPKFSRRLGSVATASLQYTFRTTDIQRPAAGNPFGVTVPRNQDHDVNFSLQSGPDFGRFSWNLNGEHERTQRGAAGRTTEETRAGLDLEYRVTRWLGIIAEGGWEDVNDTTLLRQIDGVTWAGGLRLNPSRRTDLSVRYGKEDGERRWSVDAAHRTKRMNFHASYSEEITTSQRIVSDAVDTFQVDDFGNFVDPFGNLLESDGLVFGFIDEAFVEKELELDISYSLRRTDIRLRLFNQKRDVQALAVNEDETGVSLSVTRELSPRSSLNASVIYRHTDFQSGTSRADDMYGARASYQHQFSEYVSGSVNYTFSRRESNDAQFELTENVVTVQLRATF